MGLKYRIYKTHAVVAKYDGKETTVIIPNVIAGRPVTEISSYAFSDNPQLELVVLPDILQTIRPAAFSNCENLKAVTSFASYCSAGKERNYRIGLPALARAENGAAFWGCDKLQFLQKKAS